MLKLKEVKRNRGLCSKARQYLDGLLQYLPYLKKEKFTIMDDINSDFKSLIMN